MPPAVPEIDLGSAVPASRSGLLLIQRPEADWLDRQLELNADAVTERVRRHRNLGKDEAKSILSGAATAAMGTVSEFLTDESLHKELLAAIPPMSSVGEAEHELWGMLDEKLANPMECEVDGVQVVNDGNNSGIRVWVNGIATQEGVQGVDAPRRYELERWAHFGEWVKSVNNSIDHRAASSLALRFGVHGKLDEESFVGYAVCEAFLPVKFPTDQFRPPAAWRQRPHRGL